MLNLNLNNILMGVLAFILSFLSLMFLNAFPNIIVVPLSFSFFVVVISSLGKMPVQSRDDVNAIMLVAFFPFSILLLLLPLIGLGSGLSIYSFLLLAFYLIIPHMFLSVYFGVDKKDAGRSSGTGSGKNSG